MQLDTKDEMVIDQYQEQKYVNVSLNVTFSAAPCSVLAMNLLDPKKANVLHVVHEIYKTRLSKTGKVLGQKVRDSLVNVAQSSSELASAGSAAPGVRTTHATTHLRCPSCFQSHIDEDDCCSSCDDVRQAFRKRGWSDKPTEYIFGQCAEEAYRTDTAQEGEGCLVEAAMYVRKVPATIHIGVGRHFRSDLLKSENHQEYVTSLDFSHTIGGLSYGPDFPGLVRVLDGRVKSAHTAPFSEHYQYDIHVIPTRYNEDGVEEVTSHQYSVTEYVKSVDKRQKHQDTATLGLWMSYDFTPFEVKVTKTRKSLWHFLTECCAILGGIFAFTGMLDNFAYQINKSTANGRRGGSGLD